MKKLLLALIVTITSLTLASCDDDVYYIDPGDLPGPALNFIYSYYPGDPIWNVSIGGGGYDDDYYQVEMESGAVIYFDSYGNWYAVYAPAGYGVPYGIVPIAIEDYVAYYFPYQTINAIETNYYGGYHITLTGGAVLDFDRWGNII